MSEPTVNRRNANELIMSDGCYAYTQDTSKGTINVHTGPIVVTMTGQEIPVLFNKTTGKFDPIDLEKATQVSITAMQGAYIVLWNPTTDGRHPEPRDKRGGADLLMGQRVNLPGPISFSLWPRQTAQVIPGHDLRSNQYLVVRIYDEEEAKKNWKKAVVKRVESDPKEGEQASAPIEAPVDLSVGRKFIIRGNEISFYIPPTGVEVVQDGSTGGFIRDALTLERLEYCILIDENGNKRYTQGPAVVFPEPTERFHEENGSRSFSPIEMNRIQGVHVKVIADYEENGKQYKEGDELFITGKDTPIYFPRPEHSLVSYDGRVKHFATAIPAGEGRYLLHRLTGQIDTIMGPAMVLPDPREDVLVRRILSQKQCELWYPGNKEAALFNKRLEEKSRDGDAPVLGASVSLANAFESLTDDSAPRGLMPRRAAPASFGGAVMAHQSTYTQPRQVTLGTKYEGVPTIDIWTGYAVMVVSKTKGRRVEVGPKTVLLAYDETLEILELSTGKPKTTDTLLKTVYLRVKNNQVSDIVVAETRDHVVVRIKLSLHVNFEGEDTSKWFEVENYIKHLTDHCRSLLKASVRKQTIEEFYARSEEIVRETLLGAKVDGKERPGLSFVNGMKLTDVEVLLVEIPDANINKMLLDAQHQTVADNMQVAAVHRRLAFNSELEEVARQELRNKDKTEGEKVAIARTSNNRKAEAEAERHKLDQGVTAARLASTREEEGVKDFLTSSLLKREEEEQKSKHEWATKAQELEATRLKAETDAMVARFAAAGAGFSEAIITLGNQDVVKQVAKSLSVQTLIGGGDLVEVTDKLFGEGSRVGALIRSAAKKATLLSTSD